MLVAIGISHKTAAIDIRERLSFAPDKISTALKSLVAKTGLSEAVLLSTCNRTEIYGSTVDTGVDSDRLVDWWRSFQPQGQHQLIAPVYYQFSNEKVVQHLMRLASGLESLALGETQILGQLKQAYQQSKELGFLNDSLSQTFEASFSVAKKIRTHTEITKHPISVGYLALRVAKQIFTDIAKTKILLVGAGDNIRHMLTHLKAHHAKHLTIVNRTYEKACHIAQQFQITPEPMENLSTALSQADIVITSTYSHFPIIDREKLSMALKGQKHRPILMLDLGVPRDIHPDVVEHDDVYLYSVDDLQSIADENKQAREEAARQAEKIISYEACAFIAKLHAKQKMHSIKSLRDKAEAYRLKAIDLAKKELEQGHNPQAVIEKLAYGLTNQLIHEPTIRMKDALLGQDELMIAMYKNMFGIE